MQAAFVIRLGRGTNPSKEHFEGAVEEVDTGKELKFQSSTELLQFLGKCFLAASPETMKADQRVMSDLPNEVEGKS